ncbi:hypothetical protein HUJ04_010175 [Dendroctonus ponderosae]|nr:hypothetical protein HUJ04_010175 [Dendroctonus ponderosae]
MATFVMATKSDNYKDMIETDTAEINLIQKDIRRINHEEKEAQKQLEQIDFILKRSKITDNPLFKELENAKV